MYKLSTEANESFKQIHIEFINRLRDEYGSDSESDDEDTPISQVDVGEGGTSTKDVFHILKIAALLHVLGHVLSSLLAGNDDNVLPPVEISLETFDSAKIFYAVLTKHRYSFLNALSYLSNPSQPLKVAVPILHRVAAAICKTSGPAVSVRDVHKHIKGITSKLLKLELEAIVKLNFGIIHEGHRNILIGSWRHMKSSLPLSVRQEGYASYLSEYLWRKQNQGTDLFKRFVEDVAMTYAAQPHD